MSELSDFRPILPDTAAANEKGHLVLGGCDLVELAGEFGTPLYIFDEATLRNSCRMFRREFEARYPDSLVIYACKAFICLALAQIFKEEGLGLDVVSGGEIYLASLVDFPKDKVYFHGNNKTAEELELALNWGVGRIVVDNFSEIALLKQLAQKTGRLQEVLLRISPGIDPHTHEFLATGVVDSKFGFPLPQAKEAVGEVLKLSNLRLIGLHAHLGSLICSLVPYQEALKVMLGLMAEIRDDFGLELEELNLGGGFAIQYTRGEKVLSVAEYAEAITSTLRGLIKELSLPNLRLVVEPGRAIVGRAGVALYRVGSLKDIPGVRKYVSLDGGLGDNIRPALYGARYEALVANKLDKEDVEEVTLAGRFCESGDILAKDVKLPKLEPGDLIALPVSGAYNLPLASNYNLCPRPAVVLVHEGQARLIRRRETYKDLLRLDLPFDNGVGINYNTPQNSLPCAYPKCGG